MRYACLLALSFPLVTFVGCADGGGATATAGAAVNTVCPCMGGKIDGKTSVQWNGKTVGFCCPPCIDEWNAMSEEERTAAMEEAVADADHGEHSHGDEGSDGHEHEHGEDSESPEAAAEPSPEADSATPEADTAAPETDAK